MVDIKPVPDKKGYVRRWTLRYTARIPWASFNHIGQQRSKNNS